MQALALADMHICKWQVHIYAFLHTCKRVITAGGNKDLLNPMKPLRDSDVEVT